MRKLNLEWRETADIHKLEYRWRGFWMDVAEVEWKFGTWVVKIPVIGVSTGGYDTLREAKIEAERRVRKLLTLSLPS